MTRERRWIVGLAVVATVSLALNLIFAGITIAHKFDSPPPLLDFASPAFPGQMFSELSPEGRATMEEGWRDTRRELRGEFKAIREVRREVKELLAAETLDRPALEAALDRVSAATDRIQARFQQTFVDSITKLTAEDRRRLRPSRPERPDRRGDTPPPPPPGDGAPPVPPGPPPQVP